MSHSEAKSMNSKTLLFENLEFWFFYAISNEDNKSLKII